MVQSSAVRRCLIALLTRAQSLPAGLPSKVRCRHFNAIVSLISFSFLGKLAAEDPKVTAEISAPSPRSSNQTIGHQAEPEIDYHAEVDLKRAMTRHLRKRRQQEEVHDVANHDGH
jgi:hypothetical protein